MAMSVAIEAAGIHGQQLLWTAPTFDQCRIGWQEMYHAAATAGQFKRGPMVIEFPRTNGRITFRSLSEPDNARGHTADGIIIDEAPMVKERAYYDVLRPIISDTDGWLLAQGTPLGRNWFYREWMAAQEQDDASAWTAPTLGVEIVDGELIRRPHRLENPTFPFAEAKRLYNTLPDLTFAQEFLAAFIMRAGLVYDMFQREAHVKERDPDEFQYWVMGVDEGYTNPAAVLLIGIDSDIRFHIYREFYQRGKLQEQVVEQVVAWARRHRPAGVAVDPSAAGLIAALIDAGLPAQSHKSRVLDGISQVQSLLRIQEDGRPALTIDPSCTSTIYEFDNYTWKPEKDEPLKRDDHALDALRYLVSWLTAEREPAQQVIYAPTRIGPRY